MRKRRIYLAVQAVMCVALAATLSFSAVSIYRDGAARRALDPLESIYTPRIVAEKFAAIAPLFVAALALLVAGVALGLRDDRAGRPARDALLARDLAVSRAGGTSEGMARERARQRRLRWFGWGVFGLCMIPLAAWLLDPAHFPQDDPEAMFGGLMRVLMPCTVLGLGALSATGALLDRSYRRETEAAKACAQRDGLPPVRAKDTGAAQAIILALAIALIAIGIFNGSARDVLYKAITICTECIGLG